MGWNISHGTNQFGEMRRSYTSIANLAKHVAHVLPARDWATVAPVLNRRSGDPFELAPREAGRVASVLFTAAAHSKMPPDWAATVHELASTAARAAEASQPWKWS